MIITSLAELQLFISTKQPCPAYLEINLSTQNIGEEGVKSIATLMQSGWFAQKGIKINLSYNQVTDDGMKLLSSALACGRCLDGLELNLSGNTIGSEGIKALSAALMSGCCPQRLKINLSNNSTIGFSMGNASIDHLMEAFESGKCPEGLVVNLDQNKIDNEHAAELLQGVTSGKYPRGLQIILGKSYRMDEKLSASIQDQLNKARANDVKRTAYAFNAFAQGLNVKQIAPVSKLPSDMLYSLGEFIVPPSVELAQEGQFLKKVTTSLFSKNKSGENIQVSQQSINPSPTKMNMT